MVHGVDGHIARLIGRKAAHQRRVVDGIPRIDAVVGDGGLVVEVGDGRHGKAVHFAAGTVRQIDGHDGQGRARRELVAVEFFRRLAGIGQQDGGALAAVDGAAAADAEHGPGSGLASLRRRFIHTRGRGVGGDLVVQGKAQAVFGRRGFHFVPRAGKLVGMAARHAQYGGDAFLFEFGKNVVDLLYGAHAKISGRLCPDLSYRIIEHAFVPHGAPPGSENS